ncbi:hypothetical protein [Sphingomonas sp. PAMC 26617]|uniref:hypothetical protein n=1 Tax=Sphingomonas sp. PAMC 26617 TaxID=1112216 RepID=UPI0002E394FE|nr:hypothetical protein [Sphingomonas sp. PAMC 26617]
MPKAAVFTMELESDLRDAFMAAAEASHRPAPQIVQELMREFVRRQHGAFVQQKVDTARGSRREDRGTPDAAIEAVFAARRARVTDEA